MSARCDGQIIVFEATDEVSHKYAKTFCHGIDGQGRCPIFDACEAIVRDFKTTQWRQGLHGTWAGVLYKDGKPVRKRAGAKALPREHGSDRGYYQHRQHGEKSCADCKAAHKVAVWLRAQSVGACE